MSDFDDVKSGYRISFSFSDENPYFLDTKLVKEFKFVEEGGLDVSAQIPEWRDEGMESALTGDGGITHTFFGWFIRSETLASQHDPIADYIKDDLWPNPLRYFKGEVEWMNEEDEEEDEEEEDEEDQLAEDDGYGQQQDGDDGVEGEEFDEEDEEEEQGEVIEIDAEGEEGGGGGGDDYEGGEEGEEFEDDGEEGGHVAVEETYNEYQEGSFDEEEDDEVREMQVDIRLTPRVESASVFCQLLQSTALSKPLVFK